MGIYVYVRDSVYSRGVFTVGPAPQQISHLALRTLCSSLYIYPYMHPSLLVCSEEEP